MKTFLFFRFRQRRTCDFSAFLLPGSIFWYIRELRNNLSFVFSYWISPETHFFIIVERINKSDEWMPIFLIVFLFVGNIFSVGHWKNTHRNRLVTVTLDYIVLLSPRIIENLGWLICSFFYSMNKNILRIFEFLKYFRTENILQK